MGRGDQAKETADADGLKARLKVRVQCEGPVAMRSESWAGVEPRKAQEPQQSC